MGENMINENETELIQETKKSMSTKETAKAIRDYLKKIKGVKFSVSCEWFSMGSSINIRLMESNFNPIMKFENIPQDALIDLINFKQYTKEQIENTQKRGYHQLNNYQLNDDSYNPEVWNNGVFLTEFGYNLFKKVNEIVQRFHWSESDMQTDYYNCNFFYHLSIGKWDKDFKIVGVIND
jgi:hypothetical protein